MSDRPRAILGDEIDPREMQGCLQTLLDFVLDPNSPRNTQEWRLAACLLQVIDDTNNLAWGLVERISYIESDNKELRRELTVMRMRDGIDEAKPAN